MYAYQAGYITEVRVGGRFRGVVDASSMSPGRIIRRHARSSDLGQRDERSHSRVPYMWYPPARILVPRQFKHKQEDYSSGASRERNTPYPAQHNTTQHERIYAHPLPGGVSLLKCSWKAARNGRCWCTLHSTHDWHMIRMISFPCRSGTYAFSVNGLVTRQNRNISPVNVMVTQSVIPAL